MCLKMVTVGWCLAMSVCTDLWTVVSVGVRLAPLAPVHGEVCVTKVVLVVYTAFSLVTIPRLSSALMMGCDDGSLTCGLKLLVRTLGFRRLTYSSL